MKCVFKHQDFRMFGLKLNKYEHIIYFHSLEAVGRAGETQLKKNAAL